MQVNNQKIKKDFIKEYKKKSPKKVEIKGRNPCPECPEEDEIDWRYANPRWID